MRTFDRATYQAAQEAWETGNFDREDWGTFRVSAALRGFIYPPTGTVHDQRDDDEPSQRAIIYAAICDTPRTLMVIIGRSRSWSEVVAQLIQHQAGLAEAAGLAEDDARLERHEEPSRVQATESLRSILGRLQP